MLISKFSSFTRLKRVTAWIMRFIGNCRLKLKKQSMTSESQLSVTELQKAEIYWLSIIQKQYFPEEIARLNKDRELHKSSPLLPLHPFVDGDGLIRVGGRERKSNRAYSTQHPIILHGAHSITRLIIRSEHLRLLHAGPTLLSCSLNRHFHILCGRQIVRSITRACVTCRRAAAKPLLLKLGSTRKPVIVKSYVCVFVSLSVRAVHLELVSDLTTDAFIACLRRFISRRGKPTLIWSDNGTNFVGAANELRALVEFLKSQQVQGQISAFCSTQKIQWKFIPEHAPHFGGIWEATVKSFKSHLCKVASSVRLTFEEMTTVLAQIEACLNSRPLVALPSDDDGIEALTPGHFLIGRPVEALPDPALAYRSISILSRWQLCQALVRHLWQCWSSDYLVSLRRTAKWHRPSANLQVGDVVILREDNVTPSKWPLARVMIVHKGQDSLVRVVTVKTSTGTYRRPVRKVVLLPTRTSDS